MGKVTAVGMDTITESSGHQMTGMAVSVCTTPAAPAPLPIPYPTMGSVAEGIIDPCMRTKIAGSKILTVGGCLKTCHGNEPGTLKEVVSLNTSGPSFPIMGAPVVLIELGMAGITGSIGQMNKAITVGAGANASDAGGDGSGGGDGGGGGDAGGGGSPQGPSNSGGDGGGSNDGASPPDPPAPPGTEGEAKAGHPIDIVTGTLYTPPTIDAQLIGPSVMAWVRHYRTSAVRRNCGIGWGWSHSYAWRAHESPSHIEVMDSEGAPIRFPKVADGEVAVGPYGRRLLRRGADLVLMTSDDEERVLRRDARGVHRLVEVRDRSGNTVEIAWSGGEVEAITDSVGRRLVRERFAGGERWTYVIAGEGGAEFRLRAVTYEYDGRGDLVRVMDVGGAVTDYRYDEAHYLVEERTPSGVVYHFRYEVGPDNKKRCVETWGELPGRDILAELGGGERLAPPDAKGIYHVRLGYNPASRETTLTDEEGLLHRYEGNSLGLVTSHVDPLGNTRRYTYDAIGKLTSITSPLGSVRRFTYDVMGRPVGALDPLGGRTSMERDENGDVKSVTMPGGVRFTMKRDAKGRIVERTGPTGVVETFVYDARGNTVERTDPLGTFTMRYDAHGNLSERTSPLGAASRLTHDLLGRIVAVDMPSGGHWDLAYDSYGSLVASKGPLGQRTAVQYDVARNVIAAEHDGALVTHRYVGSFRVESKDADGSLTKTGYDGLGRVRWVENHAGERYLVEYEPGGHTARQRTFSGQDVRYTYDASGRVQTLQKADGQERRYQRDAAGRLTAIERSDGRTDRFAWDERGYLARAQNEHMTVSYERDALGRLTREKQSAVGWEFIVDHVVLEESPIDVRRYSTGWSVGIERGPLLSMAALGVEEGGALQEVLTFDRDAQTAETKRKRRDGTAVETARDALGRLEALRVLDPKGELVHERGYRWSALPGVEAIHDSRLGEIHYELDPVGRPLRARGMGRDEAFRYSPHGTPLPEGAEVEVGAGGRIRRLGDVRYGWDARGRLAQRVGPTPDQSFVYTYDSDDHLIEAARGDGARVRFLYDALSRRIAALYADGTSTWFGWDRTSLVEERSSTGGVVRRVFAEDGYTPMLERADAGTWQLALTDAVGTPWLHVGSAAPQPLDLSVWGRAPSGQAGQTALRFAGQRHDRETGLVYHHHRYYVPEIAQFMTPDPLLGAGSFQDVGFVPNPTGYLDPSGLVIVVGIMKANAAAAMNSPPDPNPDAHVNQLRELVGAANARAKVTREDVVYLDDIKNGALKNLPSSEAIEIIAHGGAGRMTFAGTGRSGKDMADFLTTAGVTPGQPVYTVMCGSAKRGPGTGGEVFIDELHKGLKGQNPVYGVGPRDDQEDDQAAVFISPSVPNNVARGNGMSVDTKKNAVTYGKKEYPEGSAVMIQGQWYKAEGGNPAAPVNPPSRFPSPTKKP